MPLDPYLSLGHLRANSRLGILGEVRVPERVIADLVAVANQVLKLLPLQRRLVEEAVGRTCTGEHVERGAMAKVRALASERLEDTDGRLWVDLERAVVLEITPQIDQ